MNTDLQNESKITIDLAGISAKKVSGEILTAASMNDYNDFGQPEKVTLKPFKNGWQVKDGKLTVSMPAKSIVTLSLQ